MTTGATAASVVNQALQEIAAQATVTGTNPSFDGSAQGNAAGILYTPLVNELLRQQDWEFARRNGVTLTAASGGTLAPGWAYEYLYPTDCLAVRQVLPATWTANDPQPVRWDVADDVISATATKVIYTNISPAALTYTTSGVTEAQWDAVFQETFVRFLASALVMALGGRPDLSKVKLAEAGGLAQIGEGKDS